MWWIAFHSSLTLPSRSQTSWIWLEAKLVELGMVGSDKNYKASRVTKDIENFYFVSDAPLDLVWYVGGKPFDFQRFTFLISSLG